MDKGRQIVRVSNPDRHYAAAGVNLPRTVAALALVRNAGHLMTRCCFDGDGNEVARGLDGFVTALAVKHDVLKQDGALNSRTGSVYIVSLGHVMASTRSCCGSLRRGLSKPSALRRIP